MFCIVRIVLHGRTVLVLRSDNTIIVSRYLCMFVTRYPRLRLRAVPGRSAALLRTPYLNCHFFFAGSIIAREADGPAKKSENFGKALSYRNDNTRSLTFNYFARYINNSSHLTPDLNLLDTTPLSLPNARVSAATSPTLSRVQKPQRPSHIAETWAFPDGSLTISQERPTYRGR